jgi:chromosome segregation ATPase
MMPLPFAFLVEYRMPAKTRVTLRMVYELVESIDARTGRLEVTTDQLVKTTDQLVKTTDRLVKTTDRIDASILVIKDRLSDLEQKVESMRVRLETLTGIVDGLIQKMSMLFDEYHSISAQLKRLETRFDRMEADRLEQRVAVLEAKIVKIEKSGRN